MMGNRCKQQAGAEKIGLVREPGACGIVVQLDLGSAVSKCQICDSKGSASAKLVFGMATMDETIIVGLDAIGIATAPRAR